jgi:hypothetical protein
MKVIFHSFRKDRKGLPVYEEGCKTALVIAKDNAYMLGGTALFISASPCRDNKPGDIIDLGNDVQIVDMMDRKNPGQPLKHSSGDIFKTIGMLKGA